MLNGCIVARESGLEPPDILQGVTALVVRLCVRGLQGDYAVVQRDGALEVLRVVYAGRLGVELRHFRRDWSRGRRLGLEQVTEKGRHGRFLKDDPPRILPG